MSSYGLTYRSTMCYPNFNASKSVAIFMFMRFIFIFRILLRIFFSS